MQVGLIGTSYFVTLGITLLLVLEVWPQLLPCTFARLFLLPMGVQSRSPTHSVGKNSIFCPRMDIFNSKWYLSFKTEDHIYSKQ